MTSQWYHGIKNLFNYKIVWRHKKLYQGVYTAPTAKISQRKLFNFNYNCSKTKGLFLNNHQTMQKFFCKIFTDR